jgi:tellurite resistance protein
VVLPSDDVAKVVAADGKVTKSASAAARALLGAHGLAVEPAEFGKGAHSVLWRDADAAAAPGDGFGAATVLLHLGVTVSASDGEVSAAEEQHLEASLESAFDLPAAGRRRLRAHLRWLLAERPGIAGVKARVGALGSAERELIARYLLAVAGADGQVSTREIDTLRKLYGMLGLDPEAVHRDIHGLAAASAPVPVIAPDADQGDVAVPGETLLDEQRLADVLSSTDRVAQVLGAVFEGEAQAAAADEAEEPEEEENDGEARVAGLDLHHTALMQRLAARADWPREDFDAVAGEQGLLPAGAIETINEAAFAVTGAPLLEGDDPVELDGDVLKELLDA